MQEIDSSNLPETDGTITSGQAISLEFLSDLSAEAEKVRLAGWPAGGCLQTNYGAKDGETYGEEAFSGLTADECHRKVTTNNTAGELILYAAYTESGECLTSDSHFTCSD